MNILIVKWGALGDVVRTSYFLPGLLERYQNASIFWYTAESSVPLLESNSYIHTLVTDVNKDEVFTRVTFDYVISLDDEVEILRALSQYNIMVNVGAFIDSRGQPSYTLNSADWFDMGLLSRFGKTEADNLKRKNTREHNEIFSDILGIEVSKPYFFCDSKEDKDSLSISKADFNIGINCGAGGRWQGKRLPKQQAVNFIQMLDSVKINGKSTRIFLLGGVAEQELNESIRRDCEIKLTDTGSKNTLTEFAKIISLMDLVVTSDSLALHLAVAQAVTTISYFAPTSAAEIGLFGNGTKVRSLSDDYCSYRTDADNSSITASRLFDALCTLDKLTVERSK